ncbi:major capsid protein [Saimiriine alphaherpesvirus 1]|uniref:Major capsid protein n=1 Tax=Saimiriine herpesvirus 1 (strain MV-5-4-PSL) TaxID=10353 RepID=Q8V1P0_SHV1|nr:major capsid protein [Saimiriine alphaherpesvirus 1]AAL67781.1 UL19 [Saimiriine alphaherpesvirus 1]ADO13809.1 major capsid protein [Saimiriine alphaherpesvirus 1]
MDRRCAEELGDIRGDGGFNRGAALVPTGTILGTIEVASHRRLFDFFSSVRSDNNGLYDVQFDALLGSYCNTLSFVRFLELGLSVACVCTKFPEIAYMNEGRIQFEVHQPMIARDGPHPVEQPVHHYMSKLIDRRALNAAFSIATEALALLTGEALDGTAIGAHRQLRAIQQLARNVQAVLGAFERGTADQMLHVLLEKAPPLSLLLPMQRYLAGGRLATRVARANLVADLKRSFCDNSFFLAKAAGRREAVEGWLAELTGATHASIAAPRLTHTDTKGRQVDGVLVTTSAIKHKLLQSFVRVADTQAIVPVTYGEMVVGGSNLVTALVAGKVVRGLDDIAHHLLDVQEDQLEFNRQTLEELEDAPQTARVRADLVSVGEKLVFLEALEKRVYAATNVPYPLIGSVDLTFVIPLGLFNPPLERFVPHAGELAPVPGQADPRTFPPRQVFFLGRDRQLLRLSMDNAVGTVCHPSLMNIDAAVAGLNRDPPAEPANPYGAYVAELLAAEAPDQIMNLFWAGWQAQLARGNLRWVGECNMTPEQFLQPDNAHLGLELHPAFDFFAGPADVDLPGPQVPPAGPNAVHATWRMINGNIPLPLCPAAFRDSRGAELAAGRHTLSATTIAAVRGTFEDRQYPVAFYLLQAAIHGSEHLFGAVARLVAQCIISYWNNSHHVAFVNDYSMVVFIATYLGGELPDDCMAVYRELVDHVAALAQLVDDFTLPGAPVGQQAPQELNHLMRDPALLPPLVWDGDALMRHQDLPPARNADVRAGGADPVYIARRDLMAADFGRLGGEIIHDTHARLPAAGARNYVPQRDQDWVVGHKIYYYVVVPAFSRGRCCTAGVRYDRVYATVQNVVVPEVPAGEEAPVDPADPGHPLNPHQLMANTFNAMLHNGRVVVDGPAMLTLQALVHHAAERTTPLLGASGPDAGSATAATANMRFYDGALHAGVLLMASQHRDQTVRLNDYFYPLPVHALFAHHEHVANAPRFPAELRDAARAVPLVPPALSANYYASVRQPVVHYVRESAAGENALTYALMACYFKLSPLALYHQLKTGLHPGIAFTVLRQDRFATENVLFAERASEAYFLGQLQVARHETGGGVNFTLTQPRGNVDLGLGYTAAVASATVRAPVTDMGNLPQNFYLGRGAPPLLDNDAAVFLRNAVVAGSRLGPAEPAPVFGCAQVPRRAGMDHGQEAVCEFIATPVSTDVNYFRRPCNPRGRAAGGVYAGDMEGDAVALMYDHTQGDPSRPFAATANPWASQRFSYADLLYNGAYHLNGASPVHSPCFKFFTAGDIAARHRCLERLIAETGAAVSTATAATDVQFKRPPGCRELVEDPCGLFQEAYPPTCSSDPALLRAAVHNREGGVRESHMMQYLILDASPLRGVAL